MKSNDPNDLFISVVIPFQDSANILKLVLDKLEEQTVFPKEIIIVDSSTSDSVERLISNYNSDQKLIYKKVKKLYPGNARNIGVELANGVWIAFLDSKTLPVRDWLERYQYLVQAYHSDVVFGVTKFDSKTSYQKVLRAATYGEIAHHTVPGTLIRKEVFTDSGGFLQHVRMGEDIDWRERLIKKGLSIHNPKQPVVIYHGLSRNYISTLKKYVISAYHTARLNILRNVKDAYLTLLLFLSAIILPKWNYLIGGWDTNPFFIPHVTKIYLIALIFLFLSYQLISYLFFRNMAITLFFRSLQFIVLIFLTLAVLNWNAVIAGWMEDAILYVPHITKIYVGGVILTSIFYRGIIQPLKREVEVGYLFPLKWIQVGLLGLSLDLVKAPGYVIGAVISLINKGPSYK